MEKMKSASKFRKLKKMIVMVKNIQNDCKQIRAFEFYYSTEDFASC